VCPGFARNLKWQDTGTQGDGQSTTKARKSAQHHGSSPLRVIIHQPSRGKSRRPLPSEPTTTSVPSIEPEPWPAAESSPGAWEEASDGPLLDWNLFLGSDTAHETDDAFGGFTLGSMVDYSGSDLAAAGADGHVVSESTESTFEARPAGSPVPLNPGSSIRHCSSLSQRHMPMDFMVIPKEIPHVPSILLQYYFDHICANVCLHDGPRNLFRSLVHEHWSTSSLVYATAQNLAATFLARRSPSLKAVGEVTKTEAFNALEVTLKAGNQSNRILTGDAIPVAVLLLGISTSWHDQDDFGLKLYSTTVAILRLRTQFAGRRISEIDRFFEQALTYWWMMLSFVCLPQHTMLPVPEHLNQHQSPTGPVAPTRTVPHPWGGVSSDAQILLARVATYAHTMNRRSVPRPDSLDVFVQDSYGRAFLDEALRLKRHDRAQVADPEDPEIDAGVFVHYDNAYPPAIVILIYRIFPNLLRQDAARCNQSLEADDPGHSCPLCHFVVPLRAGTERPSRSNELLPLALHVLELIDQENGHIRSLAGPTIHLLTIAAGELYTLPASTTLAPGSDSDFVWFRSAPSTITDIRSFVLEVATRLEDHFQFLPLNRLRKILLETWRLADQGQPSFWMDIMNDRNWKVLIG
jgi:hypothetical protein